MTGTRVKPARRNEEEGDGKDGWRRDGVGEGESQIQTYSLASDSISSLWLLWEGKNMEGARGEQPSLC